MGASKLANCACRHFVLNNYRLKPHQIDEASMNKSALETNTKLSMVRFNVPPSGSVIPRFRKQIKGGPITLTHPEITRYFMTIPEAAQLVIQATAMAKGGDVYPDMGEPIKIAELARRMVELSGLSVRDNNNPDGDIEILVSGLRPGEKPMKNYCWEIIQNQPYIRKFRDLEIVYFMERIQTEIDNLKLY